MNNGFLKSQEEEDEEVKEDNGQQRDGGDWKVWMEQTTTRKGGQWMKDEMTRLF